MRAVVVSGPIVSKCCIGNRPYIKRHILVIIGCQNSRGRIEILNDPFLLKKRKQKSWKTQTGLKSILHCIPAIYIFLCYSFKSSLKLHIKLFSAMEQILMLIDQVQGTSKIPVCVRALYLHIE